MSEEPVPQPIDPHAAHRGPLPAGAPARFANRYEVLRVLGNGGFGRVYLAYDPKVERYVAVKAPKVPLPKDQHRTFLRDARAAARIAHPNVCPIYDVREKGRRPFFVMHFASDGTLQDLLKRDKLTALQALLFAEQLAQALEVAHKRGIVHRDVKPGNVLYDAEGPRVLLTDFGIARWDEATFTFGSVPGGSPSYMAPEQWHPNGAFGAVTARTDVYALGAVLFEMLTGRRPFDVPADQLCDAHLSADPPRPSAFGALDSRLDELCLKALAKQPADRYESAGAFAAAVREYLPGMTAPAAVWVRHIEVAGAWYARPVGDTTSDWVEVTKTPAEVTLHPGQVYRLELLRSSTDRELVGLARLGHLTGLQELSFAGCWRVTEAVLARLRDLTTLRALDLSKCERITNEGLDRLRNLTALRALNLRECWRLTDTGIAGLKATLPNCEISR